jgi:hypothetical protein
LPGAADLSGKMKTYASAAPILQNHQKTSNFIELYKSSAFDNSPPRMVSRWMDAGNIARRILHAEAKPQRYFEYLRPSKEGAEKLEGAENVNGEGFAWSPTQAKRRLEWGHPTRWWLVEALSFLFQLASASRLPGTTQVRPGLGLVPRPRSLDHLGDCCVLYPGLASWAKFSRACPNWLFDRLIWAAVAENRPFLKVVPEPVPKGTVEIAQHTVLGVRSQQDQSRRDD